MKQIILILTDESATENLGNRLAAALSPPMTVYLSGPLGAGKSSLIRAILRSKGVTGPIKSPTYALVEPYNFSSYSIYHFDLYRFFDENEWVESGFRDYFSEKSVRLVEWPEKAKGLLPGPDLVIQLAYHMENQSDDQVQGRHIKISALTDVGLAVLEELER